MKTTKTVKQDVEIIDDVICNKCGKTCMKVLVKESNLKEPYGLVEETVTGGYWSDDLEDLTKYTFSLCEKCLSELFDSFVVPVEKDDLYF